MIFCQIYQFHSFYEKHEDDLERKIVSVNSQAYAKKFHIQEYPKEQNISATNNTYQNFSKQSKQQTCDQHQLLRDMLTPSQQYLFSFAPLLYYTRPNKLIIFQKERKT